jgi:hypothetical protein
MIEKISPNPSLPQWGSIPPFRKKKAGGILQFNVFMLTNTLISKTRESLAKVLFW